MVAISWFGSAVVQSTLAYLLTWVLLVSAPKPVVELIGRRGRAGHQRSDADQLGRLTRSPAGAWVALFLVANTAGLVVGAAMLLPALLDLVQVFAAPA